MGKTFKDQKKYEKKQEPNNIAKVERKRKHRPYDEVVPEDDPLDKYEVLDYEYDDER